MVHHHSVVFPTKRDGPSPTPLLRGTGNEMRVDDHVLKSEKASEGED